MLDALPRKHPLAACEACPLYYRPMVPSHLPDDAKVILVGDAPGYDELRTKQPLTGANGRLVARSLEQIGLPDYEGTARINAVLCHPDQNATAPASALRACGARLASEIQRYAPATPLVALGATAVEALDHLEGAHIADTITQRAGTAYPCGDHTFTAMLHPAYVLQKPNMVRTFIQQLAKAVAPNRVKHNWLATKYLVVNPDNWETVLKYMASIPDGTLVAFDTETSYLQWYDTFTKSASTTLCLVFTDRTDRAIVIPRIMLLFQPVRNHINKLFARVRLVAHNGKYDQLVLKREGITAPLSFDTMLASFCLNEIRGYHGLKYLAATYLDMPDYEEMILTKEFLDQPDHAKDYSKIPPERLYHYAAIDVAATLALAPILEGLMVDDDVMGAFDVLMQGNIAVLAAEQQGILLDVPYVEGLQEILATELERINHAMWLALGPTPITVTSYKTPRTLVAPGERETKTTKPFSASSTDQMSYIIYHHYRLQHIKPLGYKTAATSTNEEALDALEPHPFVDLLKQHRRVAKILSSYATKLLDIADTHNRVHISFNLNGTETGRLSADDGLHGIPRPEDVYGMAVRGSFIAPPNHKLVIGDYSQAELRVMAAVAGEPFLLKAFNMPDEQRHEEARRLYDNDGIYTEANEYQRAALAKLATDVHSRTAVFLFDQYEQAALHEILDGDKHAAATAKQLRTFAKNFNFGDIYQGGPTGIWAMVGGKIPLDRIKVLLARKHELMPYVREYARTQFRYAKANGYVQTRMGRKRRFPLLTPDNIDEVRKAAVNMPIQSMASDLTLLAAVRLVREGYKVLHIIHDSIICEAHEDHAHSCAEAMKAAMVETGTKWFPEVAWDVEIDNEHKGYSTRWYQDRPNLRNLHTSY